MSLQKYREGIKPSWLLKNEIQEFMVIYTFMTCSLFKFLSTSYSSFEWLALSSLSLVFKKLQEVLCSRLGAFLKILNRSHDYMHKTWDLSSQLITSRLMGAIGAS